MAESVNDFDLTRVLSWRSLFAAHLDVGGLIRCSVASSTAGSSIVATDSRTLFQSIDRQLREPRQQRWIQIAVERQTEIVLEALKRSRALTSYANVDWACPLAADRFREYPDMAGLRKGGIQYLSHELGPFWPARGPVWDAVSITSEKRPLFVEAKAHIAEAASPTSRASDASFE